MAAAKKKTPSTSKKTIKAPAKKKTKKPINKDDFAPDPKKTAKKDAKKKPKRELTQKEKRRLMEKGNIPGKVEKWKKGMPRGGKGEDWKAWGKSKPGRSYRASKIMDEEKKSDNKEKTKGGTAEREAAVREWQKKMPEKRGREGKRREFVEWGKKNPNRTSNAARAMQQKSVEVRKDNQNRDNNQ